MSIKDIQDMTDNPVFKELQAKLQTAVNGLVYSPTQEADEYMEAVRANREAQYRMLYEAGLIDSMPTVIIRGYDLGKGTVELEVFWPVNTIEFLVKYSEDNTENSAIDSPLDNG